MRLVAFVAKVMLATFVVMLMFPVTVVVLDGYFDWALTWITTLMVHT